MTGTGPDLAPGLAWAARAWGRRVASATPYAGASTSAVLRLGAADGSAAVLRLVTEEPWRTHGAGLVAREVQVLGQLGATPVPAPRSLAADPTGEEAGHPAHLVTLLPGGPSADPDPVALAEVLAVIHAVRVEPRPRTWQPWAWEEKYVVPAWARVPQAWSDAFDLLREPPPPHDETFLHRDFAPRNVLWQGGRVTGVVDWVETSTGPAWLDVAHGSTNLALDHGEAPADAFAAAYVARTGAVPAPWWDVMDVVGFLPRPGGTLWTRDPGRLHRLEQRLVTVLGRVG